MGHPVWCPFLIGVDMVAYKGIIMARPRKEIDKDSFEKLCAIQCTLNEIAGFFDCSEDTIERWCTREYNERFAEIYAKKRGIGHISLRRAQFRLAEHNATMAIWLGKQYLGQRDQQDITFNSSDESIKEMDEYFRERTSAGPDME